MFGCDAINVDPVVRDLETKRWLKADIKYHESLWMQQVDVSSYFYLRITVGYTEKLYSEMNLLQRISSDVNPINFNESSH